MSLTPTGDRASAGRLHNDLHWLFARLKQGLATAEASVVREHGMTLWGYTVLMAVVEAPARSQLSLAQAVSVDKSKLVLVLDELETAGLVRRRPDPADRRARIIEATEEGRRTLDAARSDVEAIETSLLADLDAGTQEGLRAALRRLVGAPVARIEGGRQADNACTVPES
ncbi:MarR family winged helix-turn-helix transcriptional regulator [Streptomyces griseomycini]|uniref:DNA-binding MarR family transcriptional regulator n=1 Tax=Streptomyces griseomycini TaxID=66895 RepID=A0A7W7VAA9_9ACTN|nr:MarR family winged helix-turn-helix transcriptional regulator [Streptomyces griseomycini]MBB4902806.1 DNA-binding MarR family transcriptional regulator [Streptomyces griseomycini]GGQ34506.1 MarR family transcriptional regulator [Streptomyces griseomycini]GGR51389.1 MarR family transcriptional regulator [Streptomyces griseomycini]